MNAAVRSVVRCGIARNVTVYGIMRGYEGLLEDSMAPMDWNDVAGLLSAGGSVIECARSAEMHEPAGPRRAAEILKERGISGLIVIGGDGSFRGAVEIAKYGVPIVGIAGTIDNDIPGLERTLGFDSACGTLVWCIDRLRDTAQSHNRTMIVEAMGRHSGWLALLGGLAAGADVVLIPEIPWSREKVLEVILERKHKGRRFHLIVIAEGAGRAAELEDWLNRNTPEELEVRACIPGHIQRGGSPTVIDRIYGTRCGEAAVQALLAGKSDIVVGEAGGKLVEVQLSLATSGIREIDRELYELALSVA